MAVIALVVSSFFRMRCFRLDKASLVLKLCLPFFTPDTVDEEECCKQLNAFYLSLAEAYQKSICSVASLTEEKSIVTVGFSVIEEKNKNRYKKQLRNRKNVILIERYIRTNSNLNFSKTHHTDVIDAISGVLIK